MKVVLDTNVLVSGIYFGGTPARILDLWIAGRFTVYATPAILEEYLRVLQIVGSKQHPSFTPIWSSVLPEVCHLIPDQAVGRISRDTSDDKFIFCAMSAEVDYLISGDMDLRVLPAVYSFKILSPKQFMVNTL